MKLISLCVIVSAISCSLNVIAQDAPRTSLPPEQKAQIQQVGQAVIRAMRSAEPAPERKAVVAQIHAIRQQIKQINHLAALDTDTPLTLLQESDVSVAQGASMPVRASQVSARRSADVATLRQQLGVLAGHTRTVRERQQRQVSEPTVWQRLSRYFTTSEEDPQQGRSVLEPLSLTTLSSLDGLDTEVQSALAMPPAERREKLNQLAQRLELGKRPVQPAVGEDSTSSQDAHQEASQETPTLITRTQHRRNFSQNP